ncbi:hypothetical protein F7P10_29285 [Actinomadura sp. WMMB 499]|nr:hypothetical protein F7P10_29285 [Actinomadura sp. WMMB 499]
MAGEPRPLSVAVVGTLADSHVVDALRAFEARFPETPVDLRTATSREVSVLVRTGEAAVGLRYFPDVHPALESVTLGAERLAIVAPASHEITERHLPDLGPLKDERWLGFPPERHQPDSFGHLLRRLLASAGVADPSITLIDSLTAQKRLLEAGLGVALMPVGAIREELRIGSLRTIDVHGLAAELPVVAVRRRDGHQSPLAAAFLTELKAHTSELR